MGMTVWGLLTLPGLLIWIIILSLPWRPWSTREALDAETPLEEPDLRRVTVLIPARNEQESIGQTLSGLKLQGKNLRVILIDDQSTDQTVAAALQSGLSGLEIINGQPLPDGWSGKLWALEQGRRQVLTELILLLDADIHLAPGLINTLLTRLDRDQLDLLSLMAWLRMENLWEKLLLPAFIFFFKLLYPFRLSNSRSVHVAAAAGGCLLVRKAMLEKTGAFASLRGSLIDDCALARKVKNAGGRTWVGLTHSAISLRAYVDLHTIWDMVARTAFTQLRYSYSLLLLCTLLLGLAFIAPAAALFSARPAISVCGLLTIFIMTGCFSPVLGYYRLSWRWGLLLPVAGALYLLMTISSAWRHVFVHGARWKNRCYSTPARK